MAINLKNNADQSLGFWSSSEGLELGRVGGPASANGTIPTWRMVKVAKVALTASDSAGGALSWANPEGAAIIIERLVVDVTTASAGACTLDLGTTATTATTSSDNLIDGLDVNAAAGVFDNITDKGSNGKSRQRIAAAKWVTGSVASGASASLVGNVYIHYFVV